MFSGTADFLGFNVYYTMTAAYKKPDNTTDGGSIRGGLMSILADIPFASMTYDGLAPGESNDLLFYKVSRFDEYS